MDFIVQGISKEEFLENYWRKKPLVIRNGAGAFLDELVDKNEFFEMVHSNKDDNKLIKVDPNKDVVFFEDLSSVNENLKKTAQKNKDHFDVWHHCWFDGSYSKPNHGIGQHFDDSDNFVIQQTGKRLWAVGDPSMVSEQDRIKRARHQTGSGAVNDVNASAVYVVLEPGDVLYLPIFFPHWGVSIEESVSLTFAVQSNSPLYLLAPFFKEVLSMDKHWWNPIPAHVSDLTSAEYIAKLSETLKSTEFMTEVVQLWHDRNKDYYNMNSEFSINDEMQYQPHDFLDIDWSPEDGLMEVSSGQLCTLKNDVDAELIQSIFRDASEKTINDYRETLA